MFSISISSSSSSIIISSISIISIIISSISVRINIISVFNIISTINISISIITSIRAIISCSSISVQTKHCCHNAVLVAAQPQLLASLVIEIQAMNQRSIAHVAGKLGIKWLSVIIAMPEIRTLPPDGVAVVASCWT